MPMTKTQAKKKCSNFRSNLEQAIDIAENIRVRIKDFPEHLEALKKCPFWNFYKPFHEGRINRDDTKRTQKGAEHILNTFNPKKQVFEIEGKEFKSTADQLAVIFGLQRIQFGEEEEFCVTHPEPQIQAAQTTFLETYLKGETKIEKKDIVDSLYAAAEDVNKPDDFVKLLVLYLCAAIFFPNQSGVRLSKMFLKYVFAMDRVSWPDLIHSYLFEALREAEKPIIRLRGCTVYILFWFAEITHFISKYDGEQGNNKPRFVRWNSKVLAEKIVSQGMTYLRQDLTGSFIDPLDEGEQGLITPIGLRQANSDSISGNMVRGIGRAEDCGSSPDRNAEDLVLVSLFKKRKLRMEESRPSECKRPEHLPSSEPMMPVIPSLPTPESRAEDLENDALHTSVKGLHSNDVRVESLSSCSEAHTTGAELVEVGDMFKESVDATMIQSSSKCQTPHSTVLTISNYGDVNLSLTGSTSASVQERFVFVDKFKIPVQYAVLFRKIYVEHGHMATKKVIRNSHTVLEEFVTNLLKIISAMETTRGVELSEELLEEWEGVIKDAEAVEFNIKWLREEFDRIKKHWKFSSELDKEIHSHDQVMEAMQVKYEGLCARKVELEAELSEVKIQIRQTGDKILSDLEAIQDKKAQSINFQNEPVLRIVLS